MEQAKLASHQILDLSDAKIDGILSGRNIYYVKSKHRNRRSSRFWYTEAVIGIIWCDGRLHASGLADCHCEEVTPTVTTITVHRR